MNILEEVDIPVLTQQQESEVAGELTPLIGPLENLNRESKTFANLVLEPTSPGQLDIIDELYRWNRDKQEHNNIMLHENIARESNIKRALIQIESGGLLHSNPEDVKRLKRELKDTHEQIISIVEEIDFVAIGKIKKLKKNQAAPSFHKIWMWVLELYYGFPSSKYYWLEFKTKAFNKDKGKEFKRRIITQKYNALTNTEKDELKDIYEIHRKVVRDFVRSVELSHFLEVIDLIKHYVDTYEEYDKIKKMDVEGMDVEAVRNEEDKVLKAAARFNSVKYDVITEMQNILFMINHEFRPRQ